MRLKKTPELIKGQTDNTFIQLFRYTFVGGIAYIVDFGSLYALTEFLNIHYLRSAAFAFLLGLTTNYILSVNWVFGRRVVRNRFLEFAIFGSIGVIGLGLNEVLIWVFTEYVHLHYLLSKVVSTVFIYAWNFSARKFILFNKEYEWIRKLQS
jgi:putative flippase GtrA